jgi:hypothetical protein
MIKEKIKINEATNRNINFRLNETEINILHELQNSVGIYKQDLYTFLISELPKIVALEKKITVTKMITDYLRGGEKNVK